MSGGPPTPRETGSFAVAAGRRGALLMLADKATHAGHASLAAACTELASDFEAWSTGRTDPDIREADSRAYRGLVARCAAVALHPW